MKLSNQRCGTMFIQNKLANEKCDKNNIRWDLKVIQIP